MDDSGIVEIHGKIYTAPNGCDYLITTDGEIYRHVKSVKNKDTAYRQTNLGRGNFITVHRLVCEIFHGESPFGGAQVRHLDGDRSNNAVSNLCWGTAEENSNDRKKHGTHIEGEHCHNSVLNEAAVAEIRTYEKRYGLWRELARKFNVHENTISDVWHRRTWAWIK